jgi:hypothetical protein
MLINGRNSISSVKRYSGKPTINQQQCPNMQFCQEIAKTSLNVVVKFNYFPPYPWLSSIPSSSTHLSAIRRWRSWGARPPPTRPPPPPPSLKLAIVILFCRPSEITGKNVLNWPKETAKAD